MIDRSREGATAYDAAAGKYVAHAMTNFAPIAVSDSGAWVNESPLAFDGALDPTARRKQRVTYERRGDGRTRFSVDESADGGATYNQDSEFDARQAEVKDGQRDGAIRHRILSSGLRKLVKDGEVS